MDNNASASDFNKFDIILQGLADCLASHRSDPQVALLINKLILSMGNSNFHIYLCHDSLTDWLVLKLREHATGVSTYFTLQWGLFL